MSNLAYIDNYRPKAAQERKVNENASMGFIPLYRSIKKSSFGKDVFKRVLWENLLLGAQHKARKLIFNGKEWSLNAGQLVCHVEALGAELCDPKGNCLDRNSVNRILKFFEQEGMISRSGNRFGTVITILNYAQYNGIFGEHISEQLNEQLNEQSSEQLKANNDEASIDDSEQLNEQLNEQSSEHISEHRVIINKQPLNINNNPFDPPKVEKRTPKKSTQMPEGFAPNEKHQALAEELGVDLKREFSQFSDHHMAKGSTYKDWGLALNTWLRNAQKFGRKTSTQLSRPSRVISTPSDDVPEAFR